MESQLQYELSNANTLYHPGFSVDCVIFGFHKNQLRVLLTFTKTGYEKWVLPGEGVRKDETTEEAAVRALKNRTGLENIFLQQFHLFSEVHRVDREANRRVLEFHGIEHKEDHWFLQRFVTLGYYALVDYEAYMQTQPEMLESRAEWFELDKLPEMAVDHRKIIDKALEALRYRLNYEPIGYNLLPEKFTIKELQRLYETILDVQLERSNFKRRILSYDILINTYELNSGTGHKPAHLFKFDVEKYQHALKKGLHKGW